MPRQNWQEQGEVKNKIREPAQLARQSHQSTSRVPYASPMSRSTASTSEQPTFWPLNLYDSDFFFISPADFAQQQPVKSGILARVTASFWLLV